MRSQIATSSEDNAHGSRRYMPYVFTEQGIAMLSAVLKSDIAMEVSIKIRNKNDELYINNIEYTDDMNDNNKVLLEEVF